jgi:hypothetical protein
VTSSQSETILKEFTKVLSVDVETLVSDYSGTAILRKMLYVDDLDVDDLEIKKFKGGTKDFQKEFKFGVPNHSELEPHHILAKRNGNSAAKCRLPTLKLVNARILLRYHLSRNGLELEDLHNPLQIKLVLRKFTYPIRKVGGISSKKSLSEHT